MRVRTIGLFSAVLTGLLAQQGSAFVQPHDAEAPLVSAGKAPRTHREFSWGHDDRLARQGLPGWRGVFDRDTQAPTYAWGSGAMVAGSVADGAIAEAHARQFLDAHVATFAPGSHASDFVPLANVLSNGMRTVTFAQTAHGITVLGAAMSFAYKNDRLVLVGSTAMPNVAIALPAHALAPDFIAQKAAAWMAEDGYAASAAKVSTILAPLAQRVILPIVRPRHGADMPVTYRVAEQVAMRSITGPGRWNVWVDANDGSPIARRSTISYASGRVLFDVPDQRPTGTRTAKGAQYATHSVDGANATATVDGTVTWAGTGAATILPKLTGLRVAVQTEQGSLAATSLSLDPDGTVTWSQATSEFGDAQLSAYVFANTAKEFVKTRLDPTLGWLEDVVAVSVNEADTCNAFSTGDDVHFFQATAIGAAGEACENTGRLADVVYHEVGHSVHANSIIPGAGAFDGSLSEGLADTLGVSITGDHGLGKGFFKNAEPLRELEQAMPKHWPEDADGEPHNEGEIIGETLWDLRKTLQDKLGVEAGYAQTLKIFYSIMQRAQDIPSSYLEAILADDDDGDLTNGTPNQCDIDTAFGRHGLADPTLSLGIQAPVRDGFTISIAQLGGTNAACPGATVSKVAVNWRLRGSTDDNKVELPVAANGISWSGAIPTQADGAVVEYKVTVRLSDGTGVTYPDNVADPFYQFYVGDVQTLYCTDFESGSADWTHQTTSTRGDDWETGMPLGLGGDPRVAASGNNVLGTDLSDDGLYRRRMTTFAQSPAIDLAGNTTNVHLQYKRWLGVEDGFFDGASIKANDAVVWSSFKSPADPAEAEINHLDKEWRFQDVDVSAQAAASTDGTMKLSFEIKGDDGLQFGGWTVDDVCLVVAHAPPASSCGNTQVEGNETCDDGNAIDGDGCSASCTLEDGGEDGGDTTTGCCSTSSNPASALGLGALAVGLMFRRRRRTA